MRYFLYALIGLGISSANPYSNLSEPGKVLLTLIWPAIIVRDLINELDNAAKVKDRLPDHGDANHG